MEMLLVAAVPTSLLMREHSTIVVPQRYLNFDYPTLPVVVEQGFASSNYQPAVGQDFAYPRLVVERQGFASPNQEFAVEAGSVHPNRQPVAEDFAYPSLQVAAEHPRGWVVALAAPRGSQQA
jgi:hypothetical protein